MNEGLKNTACSPTFVDARDGIIQAAVDNFGGVDVCPLWDVFANFGLGTDAVSGGSNSTTPTNGFQIPVECQCQPAPVADAGPAQSICLGEAVTLGTAAVPGHTYSWSPGGETTAQITVSPTSTTGYTLTATNSCGDAQDVVDVFVDDGTVGLTDDFETGAPGWSATGLWHLANDSQCASPAPGYGSPVHAFYFGQDATCIVAGEAVVLFEARAKGERADLTFEVPPGGGDAKELADLTITIVELDPPTESGKPIEPSSYIAMVVVAVGR